MLCAGLIVSLSRSEGGKTSAPLILIADGNAKHSTTLLKRRRARPPGPAPLRARPGTTDNAPHALYTLPHPADSYTCLCGFWAPALAPVCGSVGLHPRRPA